MPHPPVDDLALVSRGEESISQSMLAGRAVKPMFLFVFVKMTYLVLFSLPVSPGKAVQFLDTNTNSNDGSDILPLYKGARPFLATIGLTSSPSRWGGCVCVGKSHPIDTGSTLKVPGQHSWLTERLAFACSAHILLPIAA